MSHSWMKLNQRSGKISLHFCSGHLYLYPVSKPWLYFLFWHVIHDGKWFMESSEWPAFPQKGTVPRRMVACCCSSCFFNNSFTHIVVGVWVKCPGKCFWFDFSSFSCSKNCLKTCYLLNWRRSIILLKIGNYISLALKELPVILNYQLIYLYFFPFHLNVVIFSHLLELLILMRIAVKILLNKSDV